MASFWSSGVVAFTPPLLHGIEALNYQEKAD